jgi:hypothetical protein
VKIRMTFTRLAASIELNLEVERITAHDRARFAEGGEERWHGIVQAIAAAPESAAEICTDVLAGGES